LLHSERQSETLLAQPDSQITTLTTGSLQLGSTAIIERRKAAIPKMCRIVLNL
jgi:hypothetical protein